MPLIFSQLALETIHKLYLEFTSVLPPAPRALITRLLLLLFAGGVEVPGTRYMLLFAEGMAVVLLPAQRAPGIKVSLLVAEGIGDVLPPAPEVPGTRQLLLNKSIFASCWRHWSRSAPVPGAP